MSETRYLQNIIDSLSANVAVLDAQGNIIAVNAAWERFADENDSRLPAYGIGTNYIELCAPGLDRSSSTCDLTSGEADEKSFGVRAAEGIVDVLMRETRKFQLTYPCHSPTEQRWFLLTVTPLPIEGSRFAIVAHENVTTLKQREESITAALIGTVESISNIGEVRDPYTAGHQSNVARLAVEIARVLGLSSESRRAVYLGAQIHDIGKIAIPAEILTRPGRLSDIEMQMMRSHSRVGHDLISGIPFPWPIASIVLQHHERMDGSGYPDGLTGEQIIFESRIVAVADVVDAISSHRPYRPSKGLHTATDELRSQTGIRYDADVVDAFLSDRVQSFAQQLYDPRDKTS